MATNQWAAVMDGSTLANWTASLKPIADFLKGPNSMFTQTADTGQVNWASVTLPASGATTVYEVYKLNDPFAQAPSIYLKLQYGQTGNGPWITFQFGTSTNGAGTLGGLLSGNDTIGIPSQATSTVMPWPCYVAGDANYFMFALWQGDSARGGNGCTWFFCERTRNADNSVNADGFYYMHSGQATNILTTNTGPGGRWQSFSWLRPTPAWGNSFPNPPSPGSLEFDLQVGSTVYTMPIMPSCGRLQPGQATAAVLYYGADLPPRTTFQIPVNGQTRTYVSIGFQTVSTATSPLAGLSYALRYD